MVASNIFQLEIALPDAQCTQLLGVRLAEATGERGLILLSGPLGAGKTTLVQGAAQALGVQEVVNSPTFTMINEYTSGRTPLYHLDLYRLSETLPADQAADEAGLSALAAELDEIMAAPGLLFVEWPECAESVFERLDAIVVELNYSTSTTAATAEDSSTEESHRRAAISARGPHAREVVEELRIVYFS